LSTVIRVEGDGVQVVLLLVGMGLGLGSVLIAQPDADDAPLVVVGASREQIVKIDALVHSVEVPDADVGDARGDL
jgi:hypothetical protein